MLNFTITPRFFFIPNVFSPNRDGLNDTFEFFASESVEITEVQVYSRWGELVLEGPNIVGWDFTFSNQDLPQGVYVYLIKYRENEVEKMISKDFTLLRY